MSVCVCFTHIALGFVRVFVKRYAAIHTDTDVATEESGNALEITLLASCLSEHASGLPGRYGAYT